MNDICIFYSQCFNFYSLFFLASFIYANEKFSNYRNYPKTKESFQLIKIPDNFEHPWGMTS